MPKISVVMAVHNEPPSILDEAVQSILSQTMEDLELVICDDASVEPPIMQALERWNRDVRVSVIRNSENKGAATARNRAIAQASGDYIAIMDADDVSVANRLEQQLLFLEKHPEFSFVGTRGECFSSVPGDTGRCYPFVAQPQPRDFLMTLPFVHASILFRREALTDVSSYRQSRRVTRSEDYDMLLRMYAAGHRGANLPGTLYHIRVDEATLSRRKYRYRLHETYVKLTGFSRLGLMPRALPFALKPLIVGLIPVSLLEQIKKIYYKQ